MPAASAQRLDPDERVAPHHRPRQAVVCPCGCGNLLISVNRDAADLACRVRGIVYEVLPQIAATTGCDLSCAQHRGDALWRALLDRVHRGAIAGAGAVGHTCIPWIADVNQQVHAAWSAHCNHVMGIDALPTMSRRLLVESSITTQRSAGIDLSMGAQMDVPTLPPEDAESALQLAALGYRSGTRIAPRQLDTVHQRLHRGERHTLRRALISLGLRPDRARVQVWLQSLLLHLDVHSGRESQDLAAIRREATADQHMYLHVDVGVAAAWLEDHQRCSLQPAERSQLTVPPIAGGGGGERQ